ncbi:MarR family winged helix-turn-helix transcriptional regulator [Paraburkholderia sp. EG287B]|uniref:MarR family winged helix-turn-helix transcriptional regulator n=1 Tax=unclassified Paraburkholderia TaxID=2615204 RepID=UPI0034D1F83C
MRAPTESTRLDLDSWLPYRFSFIVNHVSAKLHTFCYDRFGMSAAAWRVMAHLGNALQPMSAKDVAERAAMDSVSVTRALNQLEDLGLLSRKIDTEDRRRVTLRLNKKGLSAYEEIVPLAIQLEDELLAGLSGEERAALVKLSLRVWRNAENVT